MGDRLAAVNMSRKLWVTVPSSVGRGRPGSPCNTMSPGLRPTSVPNGIADTQLKRLHSVQNDAARLVSSARRRDHHTSPSQPPLASGATEDRSPYGNVPVSYGVAPAYLQEVYVYQWRVFQVVLVYGLHRLEAWSCRECWRTSTIQRSFSFHGPTV